MSNYRQKFVVLAFLTAMLGGTSCSLNPVNKSGTTVTITLPAKGGNPNGQVRAGGVGEGFASVANMSSPPSSLSEFQCFGVNITGPGIPEFATGGQHRPRACPGSSTPYFGIIGGLVPVSSGGTLTITVPPGADRLIQVFGVKSLVGCPAVMDIVNSGSGDDNIGHPYEIGTFRGAISGPTNVDVSVAYNSSNPKQMTCDNSSSAHLVVPFEMVDRSLSSDDGGAVTFDRSITPLNTSDFDGQVSYLAEIVAENNDASSKTIEIVDSSSTVRGSVTLASGTSNTLFRFAFTPTAGSNQYRVRLPVTAADDLVRVYMAKILVFQRYATKTRIFIPMAAYKPGLFVNTDNGGTVDTTNSTSYGSTPTNTPMWRRNSNAFSQPDGSLPFEFGVVLAATSGGTAFATLYDDVATSTIAGSALSTASTSLTYLSTTLSNASFPESNKFHVQIKTDNGSYVAKLYRAFLSVKLTNLSHGEVYYRVATHLQGTTSTVDGSTQRARIDVSSFSNPNVYTDVNIVGCTTCTGQSFDFMNNVNLDTHNGSALAISGGSQTSTTFDVYRSSSSVNLGNDDRVWARYFVSTATTIDATQSMIVVRFNK